MANVARRTERKYDHDAGGTAALDAQLPAAGAAPEPPPTGDSPACEVVLSYLRDQVAAIARFDPLVRLDEPDAVHQMRVASRRARSALQAFGDIIDREATRPLCAELRWLAATLGQARDTKVLRDRLTGDLTAIPAALAVGPVQARIAAYFTAELTQARQTALDTLDSQRYPRLLDGLDALLAGPPLTPLAARQAGKALAKPGPAGSTAAAARLAAVPGAEDRDTAIHEARKATKRARYAAEAAVPALGGTASRQAAQARELQQLLGDHHDSVVARTVLLDLAGQARAAGEDTFTYGLMYQRQAGQAAAIEQTLPRFTAALSGSGGRHRGPQGRSPGDPRS
jgi:CHAD domain-containing protein